MISGLKIHFFHFKFTAIHRAPTIVSLVFKFKSRTILYSIHKILLAVFNLFKHTTFYNKLTLLFSISPD